MTIDRRTIPGERPWAGIEREFISADRSAMAKISDDRAK
jgi:hypothetical protein